MNLKKVAAVLAVAGSALLMGSSPGCGGPPYPPNDPSPYPKLVWSQNGEHLIFSPVGLGVFVVDAEGTHLWTIPKDTPLGTPSYPGNFAPALSPDGSRVAYVTFGNIGEAAIETAALYGTDVRRLTHEGFNTNPVWSPDGSRIAFASGTMGTSLSVMDADGTNKRTLAPMSLERHPRGRPPAWSPDGRWLAFVGQEGSEYGGYRDVLYTVRPDGSELNRIGEVANWRLLEENGHVPQSAKVLRNPTNRTNTSAIEWQWSPDSNWIAFIRADQADERDAERLDVLYAVRPDGSGITRVSETHSLPAWSPVGSRLAFVGAEVDEKRQRQDILYSVRPDGSGLVRIAHMLYSVQSSDSPYDGRSNTHTRPEWSPDGKWLAFERGVGSQRGVYVARNNGTDLRRIAQVEFGSNRPLIWSPDGRDVFVGSLEYATRPACSALRPGPAPVLADPALGAVAWSPDSSRLAVLYLQGEYNYILDLVLFTVARDETTTRLLVKGTEKNLVVGDDQRNVQQEVAVCIDG